MTPTSPRRRTRRVHLVLLFGIALLAGTACTPQAQLAVVFGGPELQDTVLIDQASRIADCESEFDPGAVSSTNDHGLFQINAVHRQQFEQVTGQPWSAVYNPYWNSVYAKWLYEQEGWDPWTCRKVL